MTRIDRAARTARAGGTMKPGPQDQEPLVHPTRPPFDTEIGVRGIVWFLVGLAGVCVVIGLLLYSYVHGWNARQARQDAPESPLVVPGQQRQPPLPHLQATPELDLAAMRQAESRILRGYGWTDERAGIARIPIERAMEILARRGLSPASSAPGPATSNPPAPPPPAAAPGTGMREP